MSGVPVLEAAVEAKNGRVYVLDGVLTPPSILPLLPHRCGSTDSKVVQVRVPLFWRAAVSYMLNLASAGQTVWGCPLAPPGCDYCFGVLQGKCGSCSAVPECTKGRPTVRLRS